MIKAIIKDSSVDESIILQYKNIICLEKSEWNNEYITKLYFYDIKQEKRINLYGWSKKLKDYLISSYYSTNNCVFIIASYIKNSENTLICLDFKNKMWKECKVNGIFIEPTYEHQNQPITYNGKNIYISFKEITSENMIYCILCNNNKVISV